MQDYFVAESYMLMLLAAGIVALLAATVPVLMQRQHVSAPIIYVAIGIIVYFFARQYEFKPLDHLQLIERVTEFVVLVALTNAGLKISEPFKWKTWRHSFRLLAIGMIITIIAAAFLGWWVIGFAPSTALLFGAIISPTDPVLASELQTSQPSKKDISDIKLGLTTEAGINDGLAFPFVYFAIYAATKGMNYENWIGEWFAHKFLIKIAIAVVIGLCCGQLLYKLIFSIKDKTQLSQISRGIISIGLVLLPYAISEIVSGYGFLAVFVAACMFSAREEYNEHMDVLHDFNEEIEGIVVAIIFLMTGFFIAYHYHILYDLDVIIVALLMVFVVRPAAGYISFIKSGLTPFQKFVLSFYGIRGVGSLYYMAYALTSAPFTGAKKLLEVTIVTIFISMLVHGLSSRTIQIKIKKLHEAKQ
jgi:sodium/hydrogen antiporter